VTLSLWFEIEALVEDNVECVFGEIGRVTEKGIIDVSGKEREYDAISERAKSILVAVPCLRYCHSLRNCSSTRFQISVK
jgi:hypothetical protein